jgi:hypothetical protein
MVTLSSKESEHMQLMTEAETRAIMKIHGWNYKERSPKRHAKYVYAQRGKGKRKIERYICPLLKLPELKEPQLVEILERPIEESSSADHEPEAPNTSSPATDKDET